MNTTPVLIVADDSPVIDRIAEKVRTLAAVKPALVRLLEWQIDAVLSQRRLADEREHGCGSDEEDADAEHHIGS